MMRPPAATQDDWMPGRSSSRWVWRRRAPAALVQLRFVVQALGGGPGEAPDDGE